MDSLSKTEKLRLTPGGILGLLLSLRAATVELPLFQTIRLSIGRVPVPLPGNGEYLLEFFPLRIGHLARLSTFRDRPTNALELILALARACSPQELNVLQVVVLDYCGSVPSLPDKNPREACQSNEGKAEKSVP